MILMLLDLIKILNKLLTKIKSSICIRVLPDVPSREGGIGGKNLTETETQLLE